MRQGGLAACVRRKEKNGEKKNEKTKKSAAPKTRHETKQPGDRDDLETACDETRSGFEEIGFVQLSRSVKTTNVTHQQTT